MPRFVILWHETPPGYRQGDHWDVMFEEEDHLRTWGLDDSPDGAAVQSAELLGDHRLAYLDYVGPVSGDRGQVTRWDEGTHEVLQRGPNRFVALVAGRRLIGRVEIVRAEGANQCWRYSFSAG